MSDLVKRLREMADPGIVGSLFNPLYADAADEIGRLREALEEISRKRKLDACAAASMQAIARAALTK